MDIDGHGYDEYGRGGNDQVQRLKIIIFILLIVILGLVSFQFRSEYEIKIVKKYQVKEYVPLSPEEQERIAADAAEMQEKWLQDCEKGIPNIIFCPK